MPDRKIEPPLHVMDSLSFVNPHIYDIAPNVRLYFMQDVPNETARFDLYFDAGSAKLDEGVPAFVNGLLFSGTDQKSATEINNEIDALGGFLETGISSENAVVSMYCLRENVLPLMHIVHDCIENAAFPEHEVEELLRDRQQKYRVNLEKVSILAQRAFQQRLFHSHPEYGRVSREEWFSGVSRTELKRFHRDNYLGGLTKVVVVGNLMQDEIDEIIDAVGNWVKEAPCHFPGDLQNLADRFHIEKKGALQTAVRIGRMLFDKRHPDYLDFLVLHTLLGDYFGSRLMSNIREDKGYTYGIGSMVAEFHETGYFMIATEVRKEVTEDTLKEIRVEFERLQQEPVPEEELKLVQNYMLGQLLKSADGPYHMIDIFLSAEMQGLDFEFYNEAIRHIREITPQRIMELARQYLNWDDYTVVTAG